ncbi:lytic transglycosylase domain-containing protein [Microbacterium sp.]|uniref:aggregation-promoting factor C-terminal-like domain-containing protein n=1 Tax=Microbacterium sp. TaxID=51671 RepID=UPI003F704C30
MTPFIPARRTLRLAARRARRRPAIVAGGLAVGLLATLGVTTAIPVSGAEASGIGSYVYASYAAPLPSATSEAEAAVSEDGETAVTAAETSLAAAASITADITASGLDLGVGDTSVDTTQLADVSSRLSVAVDGDQPDLIIDALTLQVTDLISPVDERVASLRGSLDAAVALKAKQEAEAAAAAAAAQAAAAAAARPSPVYATGGVAGDNSPAGAQASAHAMLPGYGWGEDQFSCLVALWNKESGWNYQAYNASSGAAGIPQALPGSKMASAGADWQTNAATQVAWGLGYIAGRYGSPCGAWSHSQSVGWY